MTFSDAISLGQFITFVTTAAIIPLVGGIYRTLHTRANTVDKAIAHLDEHAHSAARLAKRADKRQRRIEKRVNTLEDTLVQKGSANEPVFAKRPTKPAGTLAGNH